MRRNRGHENRSELQTGKMYDFEVKMLLCRRVGNDLGGLIYQFWYVVPPLVWLIPERLPSPWDLPIEVNASDGIELPLFSH
jgi:hypothetical protein